MKQFFRLVFVWFALLVPSLESHAASEAVTGTGESEVEVLAEQLRAGAPEKRRSAVRKLSAVGSKPAWELVMGALRDPSGQVADEAAWRLASLEDPALVSRLLGREGLAAEDKLLRRRVAELIGRLPGAVDGEILSKRFSRSDGVLSRRLCASIERLAKARLLSGKESRVRSSLEKLIRRHPDDGVQAAALCALSAVVLKSAIVEERVLDEFLRTLRRATKDKSPALRVAALLAAEGLDEAERTSRARAALGDSAPAVRLTGVELLRGLGTREAAESLVRVLGEDSCDRVAQRALSVLRSLSGLKHRLDVRPWRDWVKALPEGWRGNARVLSAKKPEANRSRAGFAGLPILSDRICFLVDFSGSLWFERQDGTIRKHFADRVLREALEALPETAQFNIIPYTKTPHPWQPHLVKATKSNVRKAIAWFEACDENGSGNVFDAAMLALEDPAVDSVVCLTDGAPTGGAH